MHTCRFVLSSSVATLQLGLWLECVEYDRELHSERHVALELELALHKSLEEIEIRSDDSTIQSVIPSIVPVAH